METRNLPTLVVWTRRDVLEVCVKADETSEKRGSRERAEPVRGGFATVVNAGEGQGATLTVYAMP